MKNIAVLNVHGETLADAYEKALIALYYNGTRFKTQYDKEGDPESIDATMNITVDKPMCDPMIHKAFPGGIEDLREYVMEVQGAKDHWIKNINDPDDTRWEYCVHPDTKVLMSDYSEKPIIDCNIGDYVFSFDTKTKKKVASKIVQKAKCISKPYKITLDSGNEIIASSIHPLLASNGQWKKVKDMCIGDYISINHTHLNRKNENEYGHSVVDDRVLVAENDILNIPFNINKQRIIEELKEHGLGNLSGNVSYHGVCEYFGDSINTKNIFAKIINIELCDEKIELYDIAVDHPDHNFIGNGIICHNTYHGRFKSYGVIKMLCNEYFMGKFQKESRLSGDPVDQIETVISKLVEQPFTRQAQMITWMPELDSDIFDPPCFLAGTKILTPNGQVNIENLKEGDAVYSIDLTTKKLIYDRVIKPFKKRGDCVTLSTLSKNIDVSKEQLIRVLDLNNVEKWVEAQNINIHDKIAVSSVASYSEITDSMIIGFMHGDGWLSAGYNNSRKKPIKRWDVCLAMHPNADIGWCYEFFKKHSNNRIYNTEKGIKSKAVPNGGRSKKLKIESKSLWKKLENGGCPVGPKLDLCTIWNTNGKTRQQLCDFLTGIYSAEGCIYFKKENESPSIQLGMMWKNCIDLVKNIFSLLGIQFTYYETQEGLCKIYINDYENIKKCVQAFDFRMDSRKQSKYLKLLEVIAASEKELNERVSLIKEARRFHSEEGKTQDWLRQHIPNYNNRWLNDDHYPSLKWIKSNVIVEDLCSWIPVVSKKDIGENDVYDFEVSHPDHAILANNIVAHNCLQSCWYRMSEDEGEYYLNCNIRFRSNDAWGAYFMNSFGFTMFNREIIADEIERRTGKKVHLARMNWQADSWHIYGKDIAQAKTRFFDRLDSTEFEDRVYNFNDDFIQEIYNETTAIVEEKIKVQDAKQKDQDVN